MERFATRNALLEMFKSILEQDTFWQGPMPHEEQSKMNIMKGKIKSHVMAMSQTLVQDGSCSKKLIRD
jgi:hypothetical protein